MEFKKAERKQVKIKLAIAAPSGGGKTYSALLIAKGLAKKPDGTYGKIALIDTENGSASLYAQVEGMPEYDTIEIHPPFLTDKYVQAINAAVRGGYSVLIIDSGSHQWNGEGGIMDRMDKEKLANPSANHFTLWAKYTPEHERFKSAIVQSQIPIILTMRSKQEYVLETNDRGKQAPKKVGMAPVQRDQFEYEFTTQFDLSIEHYAKTSKDRTHLFDGQNFKPSEETGIQLRDWMLSGKEPDPVPATTAIGPEQIAQLLRVAEMKQWTREQLAEYGKKKYGAASAKELTPIQYDEFLNTIDTRRPEMAITELNLQAGAPQQEMRMT